jgi:putative ABC transport system permease protein
MKKLAKIAFRNIIKNRKRSLFIGLAIFISCFILLLSDAFGNGTAAAIINEYYYQQAGDVILLWENALEIEKDSPSRIYLSQFESEKVKENKRALAGLSVFLRQHGSEIKNNFQVVRRAAVVVMAEDMIDVNVYGLSRNEWLFLEPKKTVTLEEGTFEAEPDSSVIVSRLIADAGNLKVGDWITLEVTTAYGVKNSLDYKITGIYKNGVPWNNDYIYMSAPDARVLYDFDPEDFDSMRIYLKDPDTQGTFTRELNAALGRETKVLQALEGPEASSFFTRQAEFFKNIFTFFVIFLITIIGFGIRATVRMNLFERMSEFGTLRAIGYNRIQILFIIFCEIFLLALFALLCALVSSTVIVLIAGRTGIHVGSEAASYLFGGDYLYPIFKLKDVLFAFAVILVLSLMAPFKPAMKLSWQKISDILLKRQDRSPLTIMMIRVFISRRKRVATS